MSLVEEIKHLFDKKDDPYAEWKSLKELTEELSEFLEEYQAPLPKPYKYHHLYRLDARIHIDDIVLNKDEVFIISDRYEDDIYIRHYRGYTTYQIPKEKSIY